MVDTQNWWSWRDIFSYTFVKGWTISSSYIELGQIINKFNIRGERIMEKSLIHSYSAGLFDGEGSIQLSHIKKDDKYRRPAVSVASTTPELLSFLKDHYGGYISTKKTYKPHHKPSFEWKLSGIKVLEFLIHIKPYLLEPEKIRRCDLILNVYPKITIRNGKYSEDQDRIKKLFEQEFFHPSVP